MKKVTAIEVVSGFCLKLTYADGRSIQVDFTSKIQKGTVTAPLAEPGVFKRVKIACEGRALEWPGEVDFCADALWFEGSGEVNTK
ncbi:DUF2442 domain-containing protein [Bdellovibrionota bacterium FG-1]